MSGRDGGPAFPHEVRDYDSMGDLRVRYTEHGMSLRDWFASAAREQDIVEWQDKLYNAGDPLGPYPTRERAKYAYADAMLAAREAE